MHITYISSYVPRKCGIATYTRDLAVEAQTQGNQISIVALENPAILHKYRNPVEHLIHQHSKKDYLKTAGAINKSSTEMVHLQHEFGIFGGRDGNYILNLAKLLTKPLVVTFHTVLLTPTESQKKIIQELTRLSRKVIVMDQIGKKRLETVYGLNAQDVKIILHGAPIIAALSSKDSKKTIGYPDKFIMLANNLLSRNKGIEYAIEAVSRARKSIPNLLFLIVGETHPLVKTQEGESYRNELRAQVKKLGLEKNVIFKNKYVSQEQLKTILSAADVYITPYLDPQQISSGTLSYAIGAGKACIATGYVYAKEMLGQNKGIIVPFRNSDAIAAALIDLYTNPGKKLQLETNVSYAGKNMSWAKVSKKHLGVYKKVVNLQNALTKNASDFINLPTDISYVLNLTNKTGIIQHAIGQSPDLRYGYSTCDNARALIVASAMFKISQTNQSSKLIKIYANFLRLAQEPDGKFHTFLNSKKTWDDATGVTDGFGRAVWGLGFHLYANKDHASSKSVQGLFEKAMIQMPKIIDLRTSAYSILGLYYYILAYAGQEKITKPALKHLNKLAQYLKVAYDKNHQANWEWFEEKVTYDNFRLPQALFAVFLITKENIFRDIAKSSLKFITECNFDNKAGYYDFIGQDGWHSKTGQKANYDQQPLEASGAVDANIFASLALDDKEYLEDGNLAFEWFFGNNRNHRAIYDKNSKGVFDSLTLRGVNINQGAESIVCFLISSLSLGENQLNKTHVTEKLLPESQDSFFIQSNPSFLSLNET